MALSLEIVTPEQRVLTVQCDEVQLPGSEGGFGVRPGHTPLVAALFGKPDFGGLYFTVHNSRFLYGDFLNALLAFVIVAAVVYYFIVLPYAGFRSRFEPAPTPAPTPEKK